MAIDASAAGQSVACPQCGATVTVPQARLGPGVTVGGFKIERLIGTGGMGEVYLARQLSMDRMVALKIMAGHLRSAEDKERFIQEVRTLARLEHPNIVTAHEAGEDAGYLYLAMSYVNGEALDRRLASHGWIPEREGLKIIRKIARALEYAWSEHRLLHRDVKPGNILVDAHGEPKLADLGLAHTVRSAADREAKPRIAGTPNYMSPEQAEGRDDLDCRSDIYALGATLYHMLTGQLPYAAESPEETLRRKFEEPLPDPRSFNPHISAAVVALLSGMLAHDRAERYSTWKDLLADLDRALAGKPPVRSAMPAEPTNKVRLTAAELQALREGAAQSRRQSPRDTILLAIVGVLAVGVVAVFVHFVSRHVTAPSAPPPASAPPPVDETAQRLGQLEARYRQLKSDDETAAGSLRERLSRWLEFAREAQGTEFARLAQTRAQDLRHRIQEEISRAFAELKQSVAPQVEAGAFDAACQRLEGYDGPWAAETRTQRTQEIARIRKLKEEAEARQAEAARDALELGLQEAARLLLRQNPAGALAAFDNACRQANVDPMAPERAGFRNILLAAQRMRDLIIEAFRADAGRNIEIQLLNGPETWEVTAVNGGAIQARRKVGGGYVERTIQYSELALAERFRRLERVPAPANRILQALLLLEAGHSAAARKQLEMVATDDVARRMLTLLDAEQKAAAEEAAQTTLAAMLRRMNVPEGLSTAEVASRIRRTAFAPAEVTFLRAAAAEFRRTHGGTAVAAGAADLVAAIEKVNTFPRELDPAEMERARENLRRANPDLTVPAESILRAVPDGLEVVLEGAAGSQVTTLAPLTGLPIIRFVAVAPAWRDLSPLRGLPIEELELRGARLDSVDAIRTLPLRRLTLIRCGIEHLNAISGMALESLDVSENRLSTLSSLTGMQLKRLSIRRNPQIASLRPLSGMPLEELRLDGCNKLEDLKPLRGMPLKRLSMEGTAVADLSPLADLPIESIDVSGCRHLTDLGLLASLPLVEARLNELNLADLSVVKGRRLRLLAVADNRELASLEPLKGMPLEELHINGTAVTDLSPLAGLPLRRLVMARTRVAELGALASLPLTYLDLAGCVFARDLSVLANCHTLTTLVLPQDRPVWRAAVAGLPSLRYVGFSPDALVPVAKFDRLAPPSKPPPPRPPPRLPGAVPPRPRR